MERIMTVEGMMCQHCASRVEKALRSVDGVEQVSVNLEQKKVVVVTDEVSDDTLKEIIVEAGYEVTDIK